MNSKLKIQLLYGLALEAFILRLMEETGRQSKSGSKVSGLYNIWSRGYGDLHRRKSNKISYVDNKLISVYFS